MAVFLSDSIKPMRLTVARRTTVFPLNCNVRNQDTHGADVLCGSCHRPDYLDEVWAPPFSSFKTCSFSTSLLFTYPS